MNTPTRSITLTLATVAVALAGTMALTGQALAMGPWHADGHGGRHGGAMMERGGPGGARMAERLLDRVKATPDQRTQIRAIFEAARRDLQAERDAGRDLRAQQLRLLTQPNVDAHAVEALRQQQMARQDAASKRMSLAMVEASRVLSPEQRAKLASDVQKRRELMQRHQRERRALEAPSS